MRPRAALAWSASALVVVLATGNPVYRVLVAMVALNLLVRQRPADRRLGPLLVAGAIAGCTSAVLNLVLSHSGVHVLARLPEPLPGIGGAVTLEALAYGLVAGSALVAALLAVAPISFLYEPVDVVAELPRPLERTGVAAAAALNLVPALARAYTSVREAQLMRGWRARGPRSWADLLVPVALTAVEDSVQLAEAMEARAFGAGVRSRLRPDRWTPASTMITAAAVVAASVFLGARFAGLEPDWYPYPALTLPPVTSALIAASLLLALPALPWPSPRSTA
jgi:energy-coupling factor transport system permease protein